ncbi:MULTISPECIES: hypothetical protein [Aeromonas]|jgi:hypothetical protein|uniref:hypothetical protein n=1 Tax=Aeromonas TaxID=642 RepID=UPI00190717B3|nr:MULTISPECIES: hypothetical protein [Aeromonas]MEA9429169.1 hypothetical protein [Aeromonas caviae]MEA9433808.1 hypothetical protein [Aeromonas caviae]QQM74838.1 hypothetical protein JH254_15450 [Aeromonas caviae]WEE20022.1 hypothetical protein PY772_12880 [Aeromonas caviae]GJA38903.1 hypothetical protein KAM342_41460 [Aeromonas caviae]
MTAKAYLGDIIGGSIMLRESRIISELLLQLHIPADHEHQFRFNVNTISGPM